VIDTDVLKDIEKKNIRGVLLGELKAKGVDPQKEFNLKPKKDTVEMVRSSEAKVAQETNTIKGSLNQKTYEGNEDYIKKVNEQYEILKTDSFGKRMLKNFATISSPNGWDFLANVVTLGKYRDPNMIVAETIIQHDEDYNEKGKHTSYVYATKGVYSEVISSYALGGGVGLVAKTPRVASVIAKPAVKNTMKVVGTTAIGGELIHDYNLIKEGRGDETVSNILRYGTDISSFGKGFLDNYKQKIKTAVIPKKFIELDNVYLMGKKDKYNYKESNGVETFIDISKGKTVGGNVIIRHKYPNLISKDSDIPEEMRGWVIENKFHGGTTYNPKPTYEQIIRPEAGLPRSQIHIEPSDKVKEVLEKNKHIKNPDLDKVLFSNKPLMKDHIPTIDEGGNFKFIGGEPVYNKKSLSHWKNVIVRYIGDSSKYYYTKTKNVLAKEKVDIEKPQIKHKLKTVGETVSKEDNYLKNE
jgi:hypothetical protein